ncbi:MAG: hypothetical protein A3G33_01890 [Omnitrophica bacterium RIFCSPLOWO2_12_FULL_44_17]|uniref:Uncharacterized protein n=1 Tax=Candidatus Danuiimicrobium aquiferis TaxID=1801832 RepID=A0A1G1KT55_9BACT|nr:MAG: hypothetical protein A3B72_04000 [Omnitrophica bacterium RIFCSPHIGHO2_02_FULL_45_28]OGW89086.1 MAG: hypothetical protein A3E74_05555 [Omnitrophica bacterium RIFCSPHIGHO2_12_FULL_44_12]OGW96090.1 MAG: hypothetical protein A3G33_01890 [Omnitrophica bacterium RIFCSPLOWO2_12_FULL_44_17]
MMHRRKVNSHEQKIEEAEIGLLNSRQLDMIRSQIRRNTAAVDHSIRAIDLLVNKEKCPKDTNTLWELRKRLSLAMEENDTFRKVLWKHLQLEEYVNPKPGMYLDPVSYLIMRIKSRRQALDAELCLK